MSARYGGDSVFASSTSNPVSVNVAPESSKLSLFGSILLAWQQHYGGPCERGKLPFRYCTRGRGEGSGSQRAARYRPTASRRAPITFTDAASTGTVEFRVR